MKYYAYGMSVALRYADSRDQAAEILNDSYMKVFENIKKFDVNRSFKPWLRKIIVNTAINHYHKNKPKLQLHEMDNEVDVVEHEETIESSISYDEIVGMVQQLSPAYRAVFNLHTIEGYKHDEIAEMLGISVGTSKSNLAKAKKNLQVMLEKSLTE